MTEDRRVSVGRLASPFGIRGEIKFVPTPFAAATIAVGRSYEVAAASGVRTVRCTARRTHRERFLVTFEGYDAPETVRDLTNCELFAIASEIELQPGEYLDADLIGLQLIDERGEVLGDVVGVQHFPAQDCLIVGPNRALVPMIRAFVGTIDLVARTIETTLPLGLLD
ncbi:MAG: ribosome maturation factor RimM [Vulcanimicrobiaceae bacterium]